MRNRRDQSAFTLIELLVVVAIIAILAAMLMPSLKGAKDSAKTVHCVNNLKQLVSAAILYAADQNGVFPTAGFDTGIPYIRWMQPLRPYLQRPDLPSSVRGSPGVPRPAPIYSHPFYCPATTGDPWAWDLYSGCASPGGMTDYGINWQCVGGLWNNNARAKYRMGTFPRPARTALFADCWGNDGEVALGWPYYRITPRHKDHTRANVVCVDGHVETLRYPSPGYYTSVFATNSEIGVWYQATGNTYYGPGFKVYMDPDSH